MKFQCLVEGRKSVLLNGRVLALDANGIANVTDSKDIETLRRIPSEWSEKVSARGPKAAAAEPVQVKGAKEFMDVYLADEEFRKKVDSFRSIAGRMSYVEGQGYRFTDAELEAEVQRRAPELNALLPEKDPEEKPPAADASPAAVTPPVEPPAAPAKPVRRRKGVK